jgi:hypothetical protein
MTYICVSHLFPHSWLTFLCRTYFRTHDLHFCVALVSALMTYIFVSHLFPLSLLTFLYRTYFRTHDVHFCIALISAIMTYIFVSHLIPLSLLTFLYRTYFRTHYLYFCIALISALITYIFVSHIFPLSLLTFLYRTYFRTHDLHFCVAPIFALMTYIFVSHLFPHSWLTFLCRTYFRTHDLHFCGAPISAKIWRGEYTNGAANSYWHGKCAAVCILDPTLHESFTGSRKLSIWSMLRHKELSIKHGAEPFLRNCQFCSYSRMLAFYGTQRFITAFTRALYWSLSWDRSIQSIPSYLSKIQFNIIHPPTFWSS